MYRWRKWTPEQQKEALRARHLTNRPRHSPTHFDSGRQWYLISAACYEHAAHIGRSDSRMDDFSAALCECLKEYGLETGAWVLLPNHYHAVVLSERVLELLKALGRLHGKSSFLWNGEEQMRGRKVWCNAIERALLTDSHHYAALNYVHHNPVKHGHVERWTDWRWSTANEYLERLGHDEAVRRWKEYPAKGLEHEP